MLSIDEKAKKMISVKDFFVNLSEGEDVLVPEKDLFSFILFYDFLNKWFFGFTNERIISDFIKKMASNLTLHHTMGLYIQAIVKSLYRKQYKHTKNENRCNSTNEEVL